MVTLLKEIQSKYASFSDKERGIADYLLSSPTEASQSNIKDIADKTGVSVATVTRFCRKVSCKNFVELKVKLARETRHEESEDIDSLIRRQYIDIFTDMQGLNNSDALTKALKLITNARRIYIYGLGSSGLAAQELNYRLSRMGFDCEAVTDPHLMIIRSTLLKKGDLLIAFSRSGQTRELITSVKKAKSNGAMLVSLTAYGNTHLTKLSNEVLWTIHPGRNSYLSTGLDLSALYLIDLISLHFLNDLKRKKIYHETISIISSEAYIEE
ncbi:MurR/RpiR family transcriptional regulator [Robertmurraya kyonggiensis]|uniref:MurR/RpiR family transcriptional regulator n=1 Tax=Robertmurraya kyonggiensis TaxID=1037680 RepID=A0A4V5P1R9_9BACI|nr:MurR/RpiR family transcriptional regulator [Robertmurraya kyonggiensis]TKC19070.1 MurR/RpiR family transcriptional regulator [Robertmurraya kyonggiensis]